MSWFQWYALGLFLGAGNGVLWALIITGQMH